jgi:hypothetical protein
MQDASKQVSDAQYHAQRAIALLALEHDEGIARPTLENELGDLQREEVTEALIRLGEEGVLVLDGGRVRASRCARRLDALGLICV